MVTTESTTAMRTHGRADELNALRQSVLPMVAVPLLIVAWLWAIWVLMRMQQGISLRATLGPIGLLIASAGSLYLNGRHPSLSSSVLVFGVSASCAALVWDRYSGMNPYLFALCVAAAGIVHRPKMGVAVAALASVMLYLAARNGRGVEAAGADLAGPLALTWASAWITVITTRNLYGAIVWAIESEGLARLRTDEWLEQRQRLNQTVRSLDLMCDLLERSRNEERAAREQAEIARLHKAHFAANVSHELRTPLNLIIGFSEVMHAAPDLYGDFEWPQALREDVGEIHRNSVHLRKLIDDILDLSQLEAMRMPLLEEVTPMTELLRETVHMASSLSRGKDVTIRTQLDDHLPSLIVDRTRIRQVLLNLLGNAARFTDEGSIELGASVCEEGLHIWVADTGIGMSEEELSRVFVEFEQGDTSPRRRYGGTGLGLALSKRFVELHGGGISAESKKGVGTVIHITLPLPGSTFAVAGQLVRSPSATRSQRRSETVKPSVIVVASDDETERLLQRHLRDYRFLRARSTDVARLVHLEHPCAIIAHSQRVTDLADPVYRVDPQMRRLPVISLVTERGERWPLPDNIRTLQRPIRTEALQRTLLEIAPDVSTFLVIAEDTSMMRMLSAMIGSARPQATVSVVYDIEQVLKSGIPLRECALVIDMPSPKADGLTTLRALSTSESLSSTPVLLIGPDQYDWSGTLPPMVSDLGVHLGEGLSADEWIGSIAGILDAVSAHSATLPAPPR